MISEKRTTSQRAPTPGTASRPGGDEPALRLLDAVRPSREELRQLARRFSLDPSVLEHLQDPSLAPGVVEYPRYLVVRVNMPRRRGAERIAWDRLDLIVGADLVIAIQPEEVPAVDIAWQRCEAEDHPTAGRCLASILLEVVAAIREIVDAIRADLDTRDEQPGRNRPGANGRSLQGMREQVRDLQPALHELHGLLGDLSQRTDRIGPEAVGQLRAAHDRVTTLVADVDRLAERAAGAAQAAPAAQRAEIGAEAPEVVEAAAAVGERRLARLNVTTALTALIGGLAVSFGAVALAWTAGPWLDSLGMERALLLGSLVFPIGFVILLVGTGELFTEDFFVPVTAVMEGRGTVRELAALWSYTLFFNLIGAAIFALLISRPGVLSDSAGRFVTELAGETVHSSFGTALVKAIFAGWLMTLLTWLLLAARRLGPSLVIIWAIGFLIEAGHFNHVVISAAVIFMAMGLGADIAAGQWLVGNFVPALLGNLAGGVVFVTVLGSIQAQAIRRGEERQGEEWRR